MAVKVRNVVDAGKYPHSNLLFLGVGKYMTQVILDTDQRGANNTGIESEAESAVQVAELPMSAWWIVAR